MIVPWGGCLFYYSCPLSEMLGAEQGGVRADAEAGSPASEVLPMEPESKRSSRGFNHPPMTPLLTSQLLGGISE